MVDYSKHIAKLVTLATVTEYMLLVDAIATEAGRDLGTRLTTEWNWGNVWYWSLHIL